MGKGGLKGGGNVAESNGLTVKALSAPFEGARFAPTFFSILAIGMLVVGLPVMAATASNLGASISTEIIDAVPGRESEGSIYNTTPAPSTGFDLINSPYSTTGPFVPFTNPYTVVGVSPLSSMDVPNALTVPTTHTIDYDPLTANLDDCVPDSIFANPGYYGGYGITAGIQEIAYNISKGDDVSNNDFRVARSLQVEANKDPASPSSSCSSYDWDWNLQLPKHMFNTSSLVTQIRFDIINDASVHGSSWAGPDYCITSASSSFNVRLMMNGTPIQSKTFTDYCGVVKVWNTSFDESDPVASASSYRHTTGGEFIFDLEANTAFDLRDFMDRNHVDNYSMSLEITNCGFDCPLGFVTSSTTSTLQPIWINYYSVTAEPDAYSTVIRGSALIIGLIFLVAAVAATPLWNPLAANIKGAGF